MQKQIMDTLNHLCVEIGPRPVGSQAEHAAEAFIRDAFLDAGLDVEEQRFECPDWQHQATTLALAGQSLAAQANVYSPACDLQAPTVAIGSLAELKAADLQGHIAILYGDLAREPLTPQNCPLYNTDRDQEINRLLEEKQPAALIAVNPYLGDVLGIIVDSDFSIPSVTVTMQVGLELIKAAGRSVTLRIQAETVPSHTANIVGRKTLAHRPRLVFCAHLDTTINSPGALDNAGGVAILIALARLLARENLDLGLEFVAFTAHEYLGTADGVYLERDKVGLDQVLLVLNFDGAGMWTGTDNIAIFVASAALRDLLDPMVKAYPGLLWTDPWPQSHHSTFAWRGVPALAFSNSAVLGQAGIHSSRLAHSPHDRVEWINPNQLQDLVYLAADIVRGVQDKPIPWTRESPPD